MRGQLISSIVKHGRNIFKTMKTVAKGHSPAILAGTAIIGAGAIAITAVKCTPKYKQAVEEESTRDTVEKIVDDVGVEVETHTVEVVEIPKKRKAIIFAKTMWPMLVSLGVTVACIIGSHRISAKRIALLSAAYSAATQKASEAAEKKAEEFIEKKMGKEAAEEYKQEVEKEKVDNNSVITNIDKGAVIETGGGSDLFVDYYSGQVFRASKGYIEQVLENLYTSLKYDNETCITYSDVMENLGLNSFGMGNYTGFIVDDWPLRVTYSYGGTPDGQPCEIMRFVATPERLFD